MLPGGWLKNGFFYGNEIVTPVDTRGAGSDIFRDFVACGGG
jgi:hypothetical protein